MRNVLSVLLFLISTCTICQDSFAYDKKEVEALLLKDFERRLEGWYSGDGGSYIGGFDEDFTYWDPLLKGKRLKSLQALTDEFNSRDTKWQYYGIDVAVFQHSHEQIVLTCTVHQSFLGGFDLSWSATEVFQLIDGEWKIIHAHWSPYGPGIIGLFPTIIMIVGAIFLSVTSLFIGLFIGKRRKLSKESI